MTFPKTQEIYEDYILQLVSVVKDQVYMVITLVVIYNILFR